MSHTVRNIGPKAVLVALIQTGTPSPTVAELARSILKARGQAITRGSIEHTADEILKLGHSAPGVTPAFEIDGVNPSGIRPRRGNDETVEITDIGWEGADPQEVEIARHILFGHPLSPVEDRTTKAMVDETEEETDQVSDADRTAAFHANMGRLHKLVSGTPGRLDGGGLFGGW